MIEKHGSDTVKETTALQTEKGWRFHSADFSVQAGGADHKTGIVTFVRAPEEKQRWFQMPEELKDALTDLPTYVPLYVVGHGLTIEEAWVSANLAAAHANPIPKTVSE